MKRNLLALLSLPALFLSSVSISSSAAGNGTLATPEAWARWMISLREEAPPAVKRKIREIDDSYVIVFIPGIMGSKLRTGTYEFGEGQVDAKAIALRHPHEPAQAEVLQRYHAFFSKFDVYRPGLVLLGLGTKNRTIKTFGYDWRMDLDRSIDLFQKYAEKELAGKRVIIIAHSTGAVLAWHWKNSYVDRSSRNQNLDKTSGRDIRGRRPFELTALVVMGAPLRGSCEIARMLVQGYAAADNSSIKEKLGVSYLFANAQAAVFTFPSVFQLLPSADGCLKIRNGDQYFDQDLLNVTTWHNGEYSAVRKFSAIAGFEKPEDYLTLVQGAIEAAKAFRTKFDTAQRNDKVFYLYSQEFPMQGSFRADINNDWLSLIKSNAPTESRGDGRVIRGSAYPESPDGILGDPWPLNQGHDRLLDDNKFVQFLADKLGPFIKADETRLLAAEYLKNASLSQKASTKGWIISPGSAYASSVEMLEAQTTLARHNASYFRKPGEDNISALRRTIALKSSPAERIALFESALILARDVKDPKLDQELALSLADEEFRNRNYVSAAVHAVRAKNLLEEDGDASKQDKVYAYTLMSRIYGDYGKPRLAANAKAQADTLGYTFAGALPRYSDYTVRAKVSEWAIAATACRTNVAEHYVAGETLPPRNGWGCEQFTSKYVERISVSQDGAVAVTISSPRQPNLTGRTVTLVPLVNGVPAKLAIDRGKTITGWRCGAPKDGTTLEHRYLPLSCRDD